MEKTTCSIPPELVKVVRDSSKIKKMFSSHVVVRKITESELQKLTPKSFQHKQLHQAITVADTHAWGHYSERFAKFRMRRSDVIRPKGEYVFPSETDRIVMKDLGLMPQLTNTKAYSAVAEHLQKKVPILRIVLTPKRNPRRSLKSTPKVDILTKFEVKTPKKPSVAANKPGNSFSAKSGTRLGSLRLKRTSV